MTHPLSDLVRNANPAAEPEALLDEMGREEFFEDIRVRTGLQDPPTVTSVSTLRRRPRWMPAVAGAAAVVAAVVLAIIISAGLSNDPDVISPSTTLPAPGESDSPIEIVTAFITKWNERDVAGALAYLHPEARTGREDEVGSIQWWDNYLSYSVAAYGGEWRWLLRDCTEPTETTARCLFAIEGEPLYDAVALAAVSKQWDIRDGLITRAGILFDAALADAAADRYAREQDPEGHAAVCDIDGRDLLGELVVYDQPCGEFMAPYRLAYAQELLAGSNP